MLGLEGYPVFSGKESEYENWSVLVDDWLTLEGGERKYLGLEMRWVMQGKALEIVIGMDREELREKEGPAMLLSELEKYYKNDKGVHKRKVKEYYGIKR